MKSKLGKLLEEILKQSIAQTGADGIINTLNEVGETETQLYDKLAFSPTELVRLSRAIAQIASANMVFAEGNNETQSLMLSAKLGMLIQDKAALLLIAFCCKHAILLHLAEQKAQEFEGLTWIVAEPSQLSQPNQDPPVEPPSEPPTTS